MNKICTSLEQSKKLIELGISANTSDMCYDWSVIGKEYSTVAQCHKYIDDELPAWSLSALFDVLPKYIGDYGKCLYFDMGYYYCGYMVDGNFMLSIEETSADNPVDACIEMIIKLKSMDLL